MQLSKTYRRTSKGRKTDWLPKHYYLKYKEDIQETEEELIWLIENTEVYEEVRTYSYWDWISKQTIQREYVVQVNSWLIKNYKQKLEAIHWYKNKPHRKDDIGDYFAYSYAKNPGHWNHWTYTKRRRASDRELIQKIKSGKIDADEAIFYHKKKPVIYYW